MDVEYVDLVGLAYAGHVVDDVEPEESERTGDPRDSEILLSPSLVLAAIQQLPRETTLDFYRKIAAEPHPDARLEVALALAHSPPERRPGDIPLLRSLMTDGGDRVSHAAAASLLMLGDKDCEPWILRQLADQPVHMLEPLLRIDRAELLAFARPQLEGIAADRSRPLRMRQRAERLLALEPEREIESTNDQ